jgi:hypothetical protein|tara:strand:- start:159 stop:314 length:156 start_codon:yes stop_codon:yes gene_type:complete
MAKLPDRKVLVPVKKSSSQGTGGRGRSTPIATAHMNKGKKKDHKAYRGQGR